MSAMLPLALRGLADSSIPVGLELYSVRESLKKELDGTLKLVAQMGYRCVEFYAPYFDWTEAQTKDVRKLLDDTEPQVVFAAATTLWKQFADKSGEDILVAIAAGDRKANPSLIHGAAHDISRTLHSPPALEKIGIETGAAMVLGPFGFSISAVEYARKNGGSSARIEAIDLLAENKTEGIRNQMQFALDDSDAGVRAAAVKVLGSFHRSQDSKAIATLLNDTKLPVRLAAAAAYIDCLSSSAKTGTLHR